MTAYQPQRGDYGVLATNGLAARLIQIGDLSPWNHVVGYIGGLSGIGSGWIVEASPRGVRLVHIDEYAGIPIAWNQHEVDVSEDQRNAIVAFLLEEVGKPYGFRIILAIAIRKLGIRLPQFLTAKLSKSDGYICSELLATAWSKAGHDFDLPKPNEFATPRIMAMRLIFQ